MEEVCQAKFTLESLPAKTLLHYMKKDELIKALPPGALVEMQQQATQQGQKMTAKFLKSAVVQNLEFMSQLRGSQLGFQAYQKYLSNYQRITAPEVRAKSWQVRQEMVGPRMALLAAFQPRSAQRCFKSVLRHMIGLNTRTLGWFQVLH
jgi:hypothetical protein